MAKTSMILFTGKIYVYNLYAQPVGYAEFINGEKINNKIGLSDKSNFGESSNPCDNKTKSIYNSNLIKSFGIFDCNQLDPVMIKSIKNLPDNMNLYAGPIGQPIPSNGFNFENGSVCSPNSVQPVSMLPPPLDVKKPCPGDPVKDPKIVASTKNGKENTGNFGFVRDNNTKFHDGVDIGLEPGDPLYDPFDGTVVDIRNKCNDVNITPAQYIKQKKCGGKYGNSITIKQTLSDGSTAYFKYNHLQYNGIQVKEGQFIKAGTVIALGGKSGNAIDVDNKHVHIQQRPTNDFASEIQGHWSYNIDKITKKQKPVKDNINPLNKLGTKFYANGKPIPNSNTNCP